MTDAHDQTGGDAHGPLDRHATGVQDQALVREVARKLGIAPSRIYTWIRAGSVSTTPSSYGQLVSVAAVRALVETAPPKRDPVGRREIPGDEAEYVLPSMAARMTGIAVSRVFSWAKSGRVATKPSTGHGRLVRLADVQALAVQRPAGDAKE